jgi:hypothetical protein
MADRELDTGCTLCGEDLEYVGFGEPMTCSRCGTEPTANARRAAREREAGGFSEMNAECIGRRCPFHPRS